MLAIFISSREKENGRRHLILFLSGSDNRTDAQTQRKLDIATVTMLSRFDSIGRRKKASVTFVRDCSRTRSHLAVSLSLSLFFLSLSLSLVKEERKLHLDAAAASRDTGY